jgi:hypothetical protein
MDINEKTLKKLLDNFVFAEFPIDYELDFHEFGSGKLTVLLVNVDMDLFCNRLVDTSGKYYDLIVSLPDKLNETFKYVGYHPSESKLDLRYKTIQSSVLYDVVEKMNSEFRKELINLGFSEKSLDDSYLNIELYVKDEDEYYDITLMVTGDRPFDEDKDEVYRLDVRGIYKIAVDIIRKYDDYFSNLEIENWVGY